MAITNSREFTINVGKIADAEKWLSEGADLWKEITGKDAVIYKAVSYTHLTLPTKA